MQFTILFILTHTTVEVKLMFKKRVNDLSPRITEKKHLYHKERTLT